MPRDHRTWVAATPEEISLPPYQGSLGPPVHNGNEGMLLESGNMGLDPAKVFDVGERPLDRFDPKCPAVGNVRDLNRNPPAKQQNLPKHQNLPDVNRS